MSTSPDRLDIDDEILDLAIRGRSARQIGRHVGCSNQTVSRHIRDLERQGLIERENGRVVKVRGKAVVRPL